MIIYSVTVVIKKDVEDSWLKWMREEHIKEVMKTDHFTNWEMQKLLSPEIAADESTYIINYECPSLDEYDKYKQKDALTFTKRTFRKVFRQVQSFTGNLSINFLIKPKVGIAILILIFYYPSEIISLIVSFSKGYLIEKEHFTIRNINNLVFLQGRDN